MSTNSPIGAGRDATSAPGQTALPPAAPGAELPAEPGRAAGAWLPLGLMLAGFLPLLFLFFRSLWHRPHYQFFPMALLGAAFLAWTRCQALPPGQAGRVGPVVALLGAAWTLLATATVLWSPWLASLAAVLAMTGSIWWLGGGGLLRACAPALVLVLAIIPPPLNLDADLTLGLRRLAVLAGGYLLDFLGIIHDTSGNIIELPRHKLLVEEACSGINSVMFALAACLFYTMWQRRSFGRVVCSLGATIIIVVMGNVFRITLGAYLLQKYQWNLLAGWPHEVLGLVLTTAYLGLIWSVDQAITFLTAPIFPAKILEPETVRPSGTAPVLRLPRRGVAVACAFALVGLGGAAWAWPHHRGPGLTPALASRSALRPEATFTMPDLIGDWQRLDSDAPLVKQIETIGISSHLWHYQKGGLQATLALDYPFRGFHDVAICYRGAGWTVESQRSLGEPGTNRPPLIEMVMTKNGFERGYLLYGTVDEQGNWLPAPGQTRLGSRFSTPANSECTTYRVQVLVSGYAALPLAHQRQVGQFFEDVRRLLWGQLAAQFQSHP